MVDVRRPSILLVEDEVLIAMAEKAQLQKEGYSVLHAPDGEAAVRIADGADIDLILMDIDLGPGIDGGEAARRILAKRQVPLAFLSSHADKETVDKTEKITSYGYILKGSGSLVLNASIKMALRLAQSNHRVEQLERRFSVAF
ncbi:MAG: response regulator [Spirochaetota bacterium]